MRQKENEAHRNDNETRMDLGYPRSSPVLRVRAVGRLARWFLLKFLLLGWDDIFVKVPR